MECAHARLVVESCQTLCDSVGCGVGAEKVEVRLDLGKKACCKADEVEDKKGGTESTIF